MRLRVAIADDQALVRTGFRLVLETHGDAVVTGEASTGREAIALARRTLPDVVLMDIRMPDMDGLTATRHVIAETSAKVIVLTTFGDEEFVAQALAAGASAFLLKDVRPQQLLSVIERVHESDAPIDAPTLRRVRALASPPSAADRDARVARLDTLTDRERDVLIAVGQGLSNAEIAQRLVIGESTVKTHVGRLLAKLELRDRVGVVVLAHELGLAGG